MRRNLLSFSIALMVVGLVFSGHSLLVSLGYLHGAMAAPTGAWNIEPSAGAAPVAPPWGERKALLRSVTYNPDNLLRVRGQDIRMIFDEPELVRKDLPTIVWQYRSEQCVLDVYFTARKGEAVYSPVVHYEIRARSIEITDDSVRENCVRDIIASRHRPRMVDVSAIYKSN